MWHTLPMAHKLYTAHVGERGRVVIPAEVRRFLGVERGALLTFALDERGETVEIRAARDVARSARGLFRALAPGADLTAELIEDRREEAGREAASSAHTSGR
jgi:AbrB family looped-hinge helix DNA binding protein